MQLLPIRQFIADVKQKEHVTHDPHTILYLDQDHSTFRRLLGMAFTMPLPGSTEGDNPVRAIEGLE
jgi:hypothetical protein